MNLRRKAKNFVSGSTKFIFPKRKKNLELEKIKRVLIISLYFRGDFLFHTPVIKLLSDIIPGIKIDIWTKSRNIELTENNPDINELLIFDNIKTADYNDDSRLDLRGKYSLLKNVRNAEYDLVIDLTGKISTAVFTYFAGAKYTIGINNYGFGGAYDRFIDLHPASTKGHLIQKYISVLKEGLNIADDRWNVLTKEFKVKPYLYPSDKDQKSVSRVLRELKIDVSKPLVLIHTTAGWKEKEWDTISFSRLIELLEKIGYEILFIGDEKDRDNINRIIENTGLQNKSVYNNRFLKLKLLEVAELILRADVLIGADSAPLHMAGAMETPSVGLFGPTNPDFSNPIGERHKVVYYKLYCSASDEMQYCTRNAGKTCPTIDCMKMITPNIIVSLIEEILNDPKIRKKNKGTISSL